MGETTMKPQEVTMYKTSDGQLWPNKEQADNHEDDLQVSKTKQVHDELHNIIDDPTMSSTEKVRQIMRDRNLCYRLFFLDEDVAEFLDIMPP